MDFSALFARNIHPDIAWLARYHLHLAGNDPLPRRSRFRPPYAPTVLGYVFLIDVLPEDNDYYFSLFGERIAVLYGTDLGHRRLSEIGDAMLRTSLRTTYDRVVATHLPLYMRGRYAWPDRSIPIERLLVPMADDDGRLSAICGISVPHVPDEELEFRAGHGPAQLVGDDEPLLSAA